VPDAVEIIAHRGFSARAPENTLASIEAAIDARADAIEFDLHVTSDGVPVLIHDAKLRRTTNSSGRVADKMWTELEKLDAGSWFSSDFAGERLPSFRSALARIGGRVQHVYPEVKGYRTEGDLAGMCGEVEAAGMTERVVFISMDWAALEALRRCSPASLVGYIVDKKSRAEEALQRSRDDGSALLDFKASILLDEPDLARRAMAQGTDLAVWTVDDPTEAARLLELGVRRITTNRVDTLLAWKESL